MTCVESTPAFLSLQYPRFDVMVVNDGSMDETLQRLKVAFDLEPAARTPTVDLPTAHVRAVYRSRIHPNLWVLDKEDGGKSDALNAGINHARTPLFCAIDADTLIEGEGLVRMARPFLEDDDTVTVGGFIRIANGCEVSDSRIQKTRLPRKWLPKLQVLEYLRAFLFGRMGWAGLGALFIISGAFGLVRWKTVVEAGGYYHATVREDMELVVRMHRHLREKGAPYSVPFIPDSAAWTECPETLAALGRQRDRWQRGLTETIVRHQRMLCNPQYGRIGMVAYPYFYLLQTLGPLLELIGYATFVATLVLGTLSPTMTLAFFMTIFAFSLALSYGAAAIEEFWFQRYTATSDILQLFVLPVVETFGYRQLIAWYRLRGLWSYVQDVDTWGAMERTGFNTSSSQA